MSTSFGTDEPQELAGPVVPLVPVKVEEGCVIDVSVQLQMESELYRGTVIFPVGRGCLKMTVDELADKPKDLHVQLAAWKDDSARGEVVYSIWREALNTEGN